MIPTGKTIMAGSNQVNYAVFDSLLDFNSFLDTHQLKFYNKNNWEAKLRNASKRISQGSQWYGTPIPKSIDELKNHKEFIGLNMLDYARKKLESRMHRFLQFFEENEIEKKVIAYNPVVGIFSFDRAAIGLHKVPKPNGGTKVVTSVKDVYALFKNKPSQQQSVRIFVKAGANSKVSGDDMLFLGMGMIILAELFEKMGINIEISILLGSMIENGKHYINVIKAKKFEDYLDKNLMLLLSSDPRYFRYRGFQGILAIHDIFGSRCPQTLGSSFNPSTTRMFVNEFDKNGEKAYLFQDSFSMSDVEREIERILTDFKKSARSQE